jgi:xanthine dehydrogenase accessory factor
MNPYFPLFESVSNAVASGKRAAFCLLVSTKGSTPQSPGAAMIVHESMATEGTLGGGCVEAEVRRRAFDLLRQGESRLLEFVLDHDFGWDDGLVCGGRMDIAVVSVTAEAGAAPFRRVLEEGRAHRPATLPLIVRKGDAQTDSAGERVEFRLHTHVPPKLILAGGGHVGLALSRLAVDLDFRVTVIDDRPEYSSPERFPPPMEPITGDIEQTLRQYPFDDQCYVVIVTRGHRHDKSALAAVIDSPARYIGMIGSKRKIRLIFEDLEASGVARDRIDRVHAPIGVPIGAVTVHEIAVSIAAQLIQERRATAEAVVEGPFPLPARKEASPFSSRESS